MISEFTPSPIMTQATLDTLLAAAADAEEKKRRALTREILPKRRTNRIKFRIGMIMKHRRLGLVVMFSVIFY